MSSANDFEIASETLTSTQTGTTLQTSLGETDTSSVSPEVESSDDDEYILVPEEEKKLQEERLRCCQESLDGSRQHYEDWSDKITRRRMFALSRLRKLQRSRRERMKFYDDLKLFIVDSDRLSSVGSNSVFSTEETVK